MNSEPGMLHGVQPRVFPWMPSWFIWQETVCRSLVSWSRLCSSWIQRKPSCRCSRVSESSIDYININFPFTCLAFGRFESKETAADLIVPKLLFIGLHLLTVLLGVYKVNAMGLLPTTTSDWLAFLPHKQASIIDSISFASLLTYLYRCSNMLNYNKAICHFYTL